MHRHADSARLWLATTLVVGLAGCAPAPQAQSAVQPCPLSIPATRPGSDDPKVQRLQVDRHLDRSEAEYRMVLEKATAAIDDCLRTRFPTTYAGCFLDQERGVVAVLSKGTGSVRTAVAQFFDPDRIEVRAARWSLGDLKEVRVEVDRSLRGKSGYIATQVDVPSNGLMVELHNDPDGHALAGQEPLRRRAIGANDGLALGVRFV